MGADATHDQPLRVSVVDRGGFALIFRLLPILHIGSVCLESEDERWGCYDKSGPVKVIVGRISESALGSPRQTPKIFCLQSCLSKPLGLSHPGLCSHLANPDNSGAG